MGKKARLKREREKSKEIRKKKDTISNTSIDNILLFIIHGATYLLLLIPAIVGTHYFFPYVGPKGLYLMTFIEIIFFAWLILAYLNPKYRPKKNIVVKTLSLYLSILVFATILGIDPLRSFWSKFERMSGTLIWLHLFGFFIVSISVFKKRDWQRFFLASLAVALFVCLAFFSGDNSTLTSKGGSTLGNSSFLATYLLFNIYFALYLIAVFYEEVKKKMERKEDLIYSLIKIVFSVLILVFMFLVLSLSSGDAAFATCLGGFGLILLFWGAFRIKKPLLKKIGKIALFIGLIGYIASVSLLLIPGSLMQDFYLNFRSGARPIVWRIAWEGFKEKPIFGWGPQNFGIVFEKNFDPWLKFHNKPRFDQAHNIVMDTLVDVGILGFLTYLSLFGSVFWVLWKKASKSRVNFFAAAIFTSLLIGHFTQNLVVFDMPASYLMLFMVLGFAGSVAQGQTSEKAVAKKFSPLITIVAVLLFVLSFNYFVYKPSISGKGIIKVLVSQSYEQRMGFYEETLHTSPLGLYQLRYHLNNNLLKKAQKGDANLEEVNFMIQELEKSLQTSSLDYDSKLSLAEIYNAQAILFKQGNLNRAEEILNQAIEFSPKKQDAYWEMAKTQSMLGKEDEALSYAEKAVAIDPQLAQSHIFYINALTVYGKNDLAEEKAREALEVVPEEQIKKMEPSFEKTLEDMLDGVDL